MNLINGSIGYLPPEDLYETEIYPVWQTPFDRGSLEATIEAMTSAVTAVLAGSTWRDPKILSQLAAQVRPDPTNNK